MSMYISWISKLSPVTLAGIFKLHRKFLPTLQTRNHEVNRQMLTCPLFPWVAKRIMQLRSSVLNVNVRLSRGTITSPPKVRRVVVSLINWYIHFPPCLPSMIPYIMEEYVRAKNDNSEPRIHLTGNSEFSESSKLSLWPLLNCYTNEKSRHLEFSQLTDYE